MPYKLRSNQPPFSTVEIIIVFIAADIPRFIGQGIAEGWFGFSYWPPFVIGLILMAACMLGYIATRGVVFSD